MDIILNGHMTPPYLDVDLGQSSQTEPAIAQQTVVITRG